MRPSEVVNGGEAKRLFIAARCPMGEAGSQNFLWEVSLASATASHRSPFCPVTTKEEMRTHLGKHFDSVLFSA